MGQLCQALSLYQWACSYMTQNETFIGLIDFRSTSTQWMSQLKLVNLLCGMCNMSRWIHYLISSTCILPMTMQGRTKAKTWEKNVSELQTFIIFCLRGGTDAKQRFCKLLLCWWVLPVASILQKQHFKIWCF